MQTLFEFLKDNPYILLFLVVSLAVAIGRFTIKGYGLGMVASAIVVGCVISIFASQYGVQLHLNEFTKSLFYYLFMYGVGLRVGPSFLNSLKGDGLKFTLLAIASCVLGLAIVVLGVRLLDLPLGSAGGILAGSMTMSAALGSAEQAIVAGAVKLRDGATQESVSAMIALSYGITYIWGTVGIVLICKYLPRWWKVDAKQAAIAYEKEKGIKSNNENDLTAYIPFSTRAYKLENRENANISIREFRKKNPEYKVVNVKRGTVILGAEPDLIFELGDIIALTSSRWDLTHKMGILGPEVDDPEVMGVEMDEAEILVTQSDVIGKKIGDFGNEDFIGQIQLTGIERGGTVIPVGIETEIQKSDILKVIGLKKAVMASGKKFGQVVHPSTETDLLTLAAGMILGLLIGLLEFPAFGAKVGLGAAGGLLVSGIIVSSISSRLRFFGNTPNAARNVLEDMGLVVFVAIVGINAGASLLSQLTGVLALKIFLVGFLACSIPPFITWAIGFHWMKINPAVLMGGVAGARSHSGPCREAAKEIDSSVPWLGFPVGYAIAGILLTVFGYFAMVLAG